MAEQEEVHQNVEELERKLESTESVTGDLKITLGRFGKEKEENIALKEHFDQLQKGDVRKCKILSMLRL